MWLVTRIYLGGNKETEVFENYYEAKKCYSDWLDYYQSDYIFFEAKICISEVKEYHDFQDIEP